MTTQRMPTEKREADEVVDLVAAVTDEPRDVATLLTLFSPAFPIGGFAYSHGLEAAIREGRVNGGAQVRAWAETLLSRGSGWNDLVFASLAHRAAGGRNGVSLAELADLAEALSGSAERRQETMSLGSAFLGAARPWTRAASRHSPQILADGAAMPLPVAAGAVAALAGLGLPDTLCAYAHGFANTLVSAATRLVPLGQSEWVMVMHELAPAIVANAAQARNAVLDDLGSAALVSEIAAMRHETLQPRLFRS